jgi:hypothetical protein
MLNLDPTTSPKLPWSRTLWQNPVQQNSPGIQQSQYLLARADQLMHMQDLKGPTRTTDETPPFFRVNLASKSVVDVLL